jgi:tetratricopeptide (TPR) repeat protein
MLERLILLALLQTADLTTADQLFNSGRFAEAEAQYRRLVQQMPNESALLLRLAACEYQLGNFAAAEKEFRKALIAEPNMPPALVGLGTSLVALGHSADALPLLEKAVRLAPSNRLARRALAHAYVDRGEFLKGEPVLRRLVEEDPQDWESWFYLGTLLFNRHYDLAALSALERSLKINPNNTEAEIDRASALSQVGRTSEAEAMFQELARDSKLEKSPEFLLAYAQLLFQNERYDEALIKIEGAIRAAPKFAKLHFWKARILFNQDKTGLAIPEAEQAVALAPELPNARSLLMRMYRTQGRDREAARQAEWLLHYENKAALGQGR